MVCSSWPAKNEFFDDLSGQIEARGDPEMLFAFDFEVSWKGIPSEVIEWLSSFSLIDGFLLFILIW